MGTLSAIIATLQDAKTFVEGGDRYFRALQSALQMEKIFRKYRRQMAKAAPTERQILLSQMHQENADIVCDVCRQNGATWVKFAQFLSCRPDLLPKEYIVALQHLQSSAEAVVFSELKPTLDAAWGSRWEKHFSDFNIIPKATASVAQVHQARLISGESVAVKIQLPNVEERFRQDAVAFRSIASLISPLVKELDVKQVTEQLITMTMEELDFDREANNMLTFERLKHVESIVVPHMFPELSNKKILVTEWRAGLPLSRYLKKHPDNAKAVLGKLLESYMQQVMEFGIYHADPHPGNFIIDKEQKIAILDYGALAILPDEERINYAALLMGLLGYAGGVDIKVLFERAGFTGFDASLADDLSEYIQKDRKLEVNISESLTDIIDRLRQKRVVMPNSFISMARVLITVGGFMKEYDVTFRWAMEPGGVKQ